MSEYFWSKFHVLNHSWQMQKMSLGGFSTDSEIKSMKNWERLEKEKNIGRSNLINVHFTYFSGKPSEYLKSTTSIARYVFFREFRVLEWKLIRIPANSIKNYRFIAIRKKNTRVFTGSKILMISIFRDKFSYDNELE